MTNVAVFFVIVLTVTAILAQREQSRFLLLVTFVEILMASYVLCLAFDAPGMLLWLPLIIGLTIQEIWMHKKSIYL
jgi:hypothetical protein